jgi:hypothetical protein
MVVSQNGWTANDRSVIQTYTVGKGIKVPLRKGDAGFLLKHIADWFDANIKDIDAGILDDWGYAERDVRGGTDLSNHASGTAIDVNATKWPLGVEPTSYLTIDQINRLRQQLKFYEGAIRWGGDYVGRKDPMHLEIDADAATVTRIANKIREGGDDEMSPADKQWIEGRLNELVALVKGYGTRTEILQNQLVPGYGRRVEHIEAQVAEILTKLNK